MTDDLKITYRDPAKLKGYDRNARTHSELQIKQIRRSIEEFGFTNPILLMDDRKTIGAGHGRVAAALLDPPLARVPTITLTGLSADQWRAYVIADNQLALNAGWDIDVLKFELGELHLADFDITLTGLSAFDLGELNIPGFADPPSPTPIESVVGSLAARFGIAPFSVLNAREGWWQERKRAWLSLGIKSEVGRGENLLKMSDTMLEPDPAKRMANGKRPPASFGQDLMRGEGKFKAIPGGGGGGVWKSKTADGYQTDAQIKGRETASLKGGLTFGTSAHPYDGASSGTAATGTSIFDPVLCELAYRWFSPPGAKILDPFAGGSVRGVVAGWLGRSYLGIDLRAEQVEANRAQAEAIFAKRKAACPDWIVGDSSLVIADLDCEADFIFSCPPYADLEVYSDDVRDLSTMEYTAFVAVYRAIIAAACAKLKADRFACFVVGDVRDPKGSYRGFVPDTVRAFSDAGLKFYNEAILVTAAGSLPMRTGRTFEATRKLGKTHQNVLVFLKGDAKRATAALGAAEFGDPFVSGSGEDS